MKAVPDLAEEIGLTEDETGVDPGYLTFVLSEWDAQALEEALLLQGASGAEVVAVGLADDPEIDQLLCTALAKGADAAVKIVSTTAGTAGSLWRAKRGPDCRPGRSTGGVHLRPARWPACRPGGHGRAGRRRPGRAVGADSVGHGIEPQDTWGS
jgi:hypothetical protein